MAVVESIPEKVQTPSAQKGVLDYCTQPSKTFDEGEQLAYISGYNCISEMANESFLATQKLFGHAAGGVRFYHLCNPLCPEKIFLRRRSTKSEWSLSKASATVKQSSPRISTANICTITLSYAPMTLITVGNCITINFFLPSCEKRAMKSAGRTD